MAEKVYVGRDNEIDLVLQLNGAPADLSSVTQIDVVMGNGAPVVSSKDPANGPVKWSQAGYATGEIRIFLGQQQIPASSTAHAAYIVVYDSANQHGIVWGYISVIVMEGI